MKSIWLFVEPPLIYMGSFWGGKAFAVMHTYDPFLVGWLCASSAVLLRFYLCKYRGEIVFTSDTP